MKSPWTVGKIKLIENPNENQIKRYQNTKDLFALDIFYTPILSKQFGRQFFLSFKYSSQITSLSETQSHQSTIRAMSHLDWKTNTKDGRTQKHNDQGSWSVSGQTNAHFFRHWKISRLN